MNEKIKTPEAYVKRMLDEAGYIHDIYGKKVLENSCGDGQILCEIIERYMQNAIQKGIDPEELKESLQHNIRGYEIDQKQINLCRRKLDLLASNYGLQNVKWDLRQEDYLKSECEQFDYIFSNPPYITYHDLTEQQRKNLKDSFKSCKEGRFDYYYAFIEKSISELKQKGIMVFLIPFSLFRNRYAEQLRCMLLPGLEKIIDLQGKNIFPGVLISAAIIKYTCEKKDQKVTYLCESKGKVTTLNESQLTGKWFFECSKGEKRRFGDDFIIKNSIATLYNNAYLFESQKEDEKYYLIDEQFKIEKEIAYPAISVMSRKYRKKLMIIVPYSLYEGGYRSFSKDEFESKFPEATKYLKQKNDELSKRSMDKNAAWFEYGRTQALSSVIGEKLVISMVATNQYHVLYARENEIPYAGYFVKAKDEQKVSLSQAKSILESAEFYQYICEHGTPTTKNSYRIAVQEIRNYPIDISASALQSGQVLG